MLLLLHHSVSTTTSSAPLPDVTTIISSMGDMTATATDVPSTTSPDTGATTVVTSTVTPVPHHEVIGTGSSRVKLPKVKRKKFNGDLTKWEAFWSSFESSIHLNPGLTAVDKFHYLSSLLKGPAFAAVAGLNSPHQIILRPLILSLSVTVINS